MEKFFVANPIVDDVIAAGVSGGADSLALALRLNDWAKKNGKKVVALTVDHKLRSESGEEAAYVDGSDYAITTNSNDPKAPDLFDNYREGTAWNVGVGYKFGPIKTSVGFFEAKAENTSNRDRIFLWSNDFQVNKYLNIYAAAAHVDFRGENSDVENNQKGYAFVAGFGLNF